MQGTVQDAKCLSPFLLASGISAGGRDEPCPETALLIKGRKVKSATREAETKFPGHFTENAGATERIDMGVASVSKVRRDGRIC